MIFVSYIKTYIGETRDSIFKNSTGRITNSRYEAISIGTALALRENSGLISKANYDFVEDDDFKSLVRGDGSNNPGELIKRVEFVKNKLLGDATNDKDKNPV